MNLSHALAPAVLALCIMVLIVPVYGEAGAVVPGGGQGQGNAQPSGPGTPANAGPGQGQQNRMPSENPVSPPGQTVNTTSGAATTVPTKAPVTQTIPVETPVQKNTSITGKNTPGVATAGSTTQQSPAAPPAANNGGSLLPMLIVLVAICILGAVSYGIYRWKKSTKNDTPAPVISSRETVVAPNTLPPDRDLQRQDSFQHLPPELSERYPDAEFIGKGGFAAVFRAKRRDGNIVAVKVPLVMNSTTGKSFIAEIQNWTKLSHPNIVRVYDYNIMPVPYLELEYCDSSLACLARPLSCIEAEMLIFGVCEGLKFTHAQGLIHRDLKPENILLKDWVPKISDWGLSKEIDQPTMTTTTIFTPSFAAPEQINHQHKDERTDIWQLGVILYELVTGEQPFPGESAQDIMTGILMREPQSPVEINPDAEDLSPVIEQCLKKDPALRYQSVSELQAALVDTLNRSCDQIFAEWKKSGDLLQYDFFYGEILLINIKCGNVSRACSLASDILTSVTGSGDLGMEEMVMRLNQLLDSGSDEIPAVLIQDAESVVNRIKRQSRTRAKGSNTTKRM